MHYTCPIVFLERYQRIFGLDMEQSDEQSRMIGDLARRFIRCMVSHSSFLKFKTSQISAAALILAINVYQSPIAEQIGLPSQLKDLYQRSAFYEVPTAEAVGEMSPTTKEAKKGPLAHWNSGVRRLTSKCVGKDLTPCYKVLIKLVNKYEFENGLTADKSLFLEPTHTSPVKKSKVI